MQHARLISSLTELVAAAAMFNPLTVKRKRMGKRVGPERKQKREKTGFRVKTQMHATFKSDQSYSGTALIHNSIPLLNSIPTVYHSHKHTCKNPHTFRFLTSSISALSRTWSKEYDITSSPSLKTVVSRS